MLWLSVPSPVAAMLSWLTPIAVRAACCKISANMSLSSLLNKFLLRKSLFPEHRSSEACLPVVFGL